MISIYTKEEVDKLLEEKIGAIMRELAQLKASIPDWITLDQAMQLTGRSEKWFQMHQKNDTLPIKRLPKTEHDRRTRYSRTDCVAYGIKHRILPSETR